MTHEITFLIALAVTLLVSWLVVAYLKQPLHRVLCDLCGAEHRAAFWTAYANILLMLVPVATLLLGRSGDPPAESAVFVAVDLLRWSLVGLIVSAVMIAFAVAAFIWPARTPIAVSSDQVDGLQRLLARVDEHAPRSPRPRR